MAQQYQTYELGHARETAVCKKFVGLSQALSSDDVRISFSEGNSLWAIARPIN